MKFFKDNISNKNFFDNLFQNNPLNDLQKTQIKPFEPLITTGILAKNLEKKFINADSLDLSMLTAAFLIREHYIRTYGFKLINESFLTLCSSLFKNKKILDLGAGSGFLSHCLQNQGLDVTPVDIKKEKNVYGFDKKFTEIIESDGVRFLNDFGKNYDLIILSWPDYESNFGYEILSRMRKNQELLYIGEGYGGCTADNQFHDLLDKKCVLKEKETEQFYQTNASWNGIHDRPMLYKVIYEI